MVHPKHKNGGHQFRSYLGHGNGVIYAEDRQRVWQEVGHYDQLKAGLRLIFSLNLANENFCATLSLCCGAEIYIVSFRHLISHSPLLLWSFSFVSLHSSETKNEFFCSQIEDF